MCCCPKKLAAYNALKRYDLDYIYLNTISYFVCGFKGRNKYKHTYHKLIYFSEISRETFLFLSEFTIFNIKNCWLLRKSLQVIAIIDSYVLWNQRQPSLIWSVNCVIFIMYWMDSSQNLRIVNKNSKLLNS